MRISILIMTLFFYSYLSISEEATTHEKLKNSLKRIEQSLQEQNSYWVNVCGYDFFVNPGVFSPAYFITTDFQTRSLPMQQDENFLEIGTGIGTIAIVAAKEYNNQVVAIDINPLAVKTAKLNAKHHEVNIDVREGDVFSAINSSEKFHTIFWASPFVYAETDEITLTMPQRAVVDPSYEAIGRYLKHARDYLYKDGRIFISFSSLGNEEKFNELLETYDYIKKLIAYNITMNREGLKIIYYQYQLIDKMAFHEALQIKRLRLLKENDLSIPLCKSFMLKEKGATAISQLIDCREGSQDS